MKKYLVGGVFLLAACALTGCGGIVDEGNEGVETYVGKVSKEPVYGFYTAILSNVDEYTLKQVSVPVKNMQPRAKDNLTLSDLDLEIYYHTVKGSMPTFHAEKAGQSLLRQSDGVWLPGYNMIMSLTRSIAMDAVSKFDSLTIHTQRNLLEADIMQQLQEELERGSPNTFIIDRVTVSNLKTDESIEASIRDNVTASKRLDTATKNTQIKMEEAKAIDAVNPSLTEEYLRHEYNMAITACASNPKCTLIVDGSGSSKILSVGGK